MSSPKTVTFPAEQAALSLMSPRGETSVKVRLSGLEKNSPSPIPLAEMEDNTLAKHRNLPQQLCLKYHRPLFALNIQISDTAFKIPPSGIYLFSPQWPQHFVATVLLHSSLCLYWINTFGFSCIATFQFLKTQYPFWPSILERKQIHHTNKRNPPSAITVLQTPLNQRCAMLGWIKSALFCKLYKHFSLSLLEGTHICICYNLLLFD